MTTKETRGVRGELAQSSALPLRAAKTVACFAAPRLCDDEPAPFAGIRLSSKHADAAAALLPLLLCGEESAILAFGSLSRAADNAGVTVLARIARDEQVHDHLLQRLKLALPHHADDLLRRAARRFFVGIGDEDTGHHCVRIVALDSAVCVVLGALRARGRPLAGDCVVRSVLEHIHRDEARHVRITSQIVVERVNPRRARDLAIEVRTGLLRLLRNRFDAFECLGVDPDGLSTRLLNLPMTLFRR